MMAAKTEPGYADMLERFREARDEELDGLREELHALGTLLVEDAGELDVAVADGHFEEVRETVERLAAGLHAVDVDDLQNLLAVFLPGDEPGELTLPEISTPAGASGWRRLRSEDPEDYECLDVEGGDESQAHEAKLENRVARIGDHLRAWIEQAGEFLWVADAEALDPAEVAKIPGACADYAARIESTRGLWFDALAELAGVAPGRAGIAGEAVESLQAWRRKLSED